MSGNGLTLEQMVVILRDYTQARSQTLAELFGVSTETIRRLRRGESIQARKAGVLAKVPRERLGAVMEQRGEVEREEAKGPLPEVGPLSAGELDAMAQRLMALQQQQAGGQAGGKGGV